MIMMAIPETGNAGGDNLNNGAIIHRPLGFEAPYSAGPDERTPRHPQENQLVKLGVTTPVKASPSKIYCHWRLNGVVQTPLSLVKVGLAPRQVSPFLAVSPLHEAGVETDTIDSAINDTETGQLCWESSFGPFSFGDQIEYGFGEDASEVTNKVYPFGFKVRAWRPLHLNGNTLVWETPGGELQQLATLGLETFAENTFRLSLQVMAKPDNGEASAEVMHREASNGITQLTLDENGLRLVTDKDRVVLQSAAPLFEGLLSSEGELEAVRFNFSATSTDFYGLGERFDHLNQRGHTPDIRVYEQYKNQGSRTYFPIPFGFSPDGYGLYLESNTYACFLLPEEGPAACEIELAGPDLAIYLFSGTPRQILQSYTVLTGRPVLPPDWIFTPWISGNEWNTQAQIMERVNRSEELGIPAGVVVIEAWADETTFYIWNDAEYQPRSPKEPPHLADFTFPPDGHWPDPKAMVDELHRRGLKVILWQIPVLKSFEDVERSMAERAAAGQKPQTAGLEQHRLDVAYTLEQGFVVRNADGTPYRNPGIWFNEAYVLDVTNPAAREWWMLRRDYLVEELGIDGFKTDGGEHLWGRDLQFWDGRRGSELINLYPRLYSQMYFDTLQKWRPGEGVTFSRAGFTGSQLAPCHWAGDENSTFAAFRHSVVAGLSAGLSGIPFWGWDIGGFSGPLPSSELFLRAAAMSVFCPIMQYHSEYNAHLKPSRDRTPWNIAEQNNTPWLVEDFARLARLRMELIPYLSAAARHSSATGEPMMRALVFDWPDDPQCRKIEDQYMLGSRYLIAPVLEEAADTRNVYLPEGRWRDWWEGKDSSILEGGQTLINYPAPLREKPVLVFERV
jgi:alpha-glucosidase (family GH31 glycosyl hydrolase)